MSRSSNFLNASAGRAGRRITSLDSVEEFIESLYQIRGTISLSTIREVTISLSRIAAEFFTFTRSNAHTVDGIDAWPLSVNDPLLWGASLEGPEGSLWEGCTIELTIRFRISYPNTAPEIHFVRMYGHPNIGQSEQSVQVNVPDNANFLDRAADEELQKLEVPMHAICTSLLADRYSPAYTLHTLLIALRSLFNEPEWLSPLTGPAAKAYFTLGHEAYRARIVEQFVGQPTLLPRPEIDFADSQLARLIAALPELRKDIEKKELRQPKSRR